MQSIIGFGFDLLVLAFLAIWLMGGIPFDGRMLLRHGADPRRVMVLLLILGFLLPSFLRQQSFAVRAVREAGRLLLRRRVRWVLLIFVGLWAAALGVLQMLALRYPLYDVGIFHQILWNLVHGNGFASTVSGAGNFLRDHASVSLVFLTPIYMLTQSSPLSLPVIHAILVFLGVTAWLFLAERVPAVSDEFRQRLAAATVVFGISFDSLWGNLRWGFHENALAFFGLSWGLVLLFLEMMRPDVRRWARLLKKALALLLFLMAAGSKEIVLLDVGLLIAVWALWEGIQNRGVIRVFSMGLLLALSFGLFLLFVGFEQMPHPVDKNYFGRYYSYLGGNLHEFVQSFLSSPLLLPRKIAEAIGVVPLLQYLKTVFLPWLGLPLLWWLWGIRSLKHKGTPSANPIGYSSRAMTCLLALSLLAMAPSFLSAALSTYSPLRGSGFHYVLELWPFLAVLTILALGRLSLASKYWNWVWVWPVLALFSLDQDPWRQVFEYREGARAVSSARTAMLAIPVEQSVLGHELAGPWIAGRPSVMRWPQRFLFKDHCPDWIVLPAAEPVPSLPDCHGGKPWQAAWSTGGWVGYFTATM